MNLPYSVIRGEIVAIPIVVFNYINKDLTVEVVLENDGDFEFAEVSNEVHETKSKKRFFLSLINSNFNNYYHFLFTLKNWNYIDLRKSLFHQTLPRACHL